MVDGADAGSAIDIGDCMSISAARELGSPQTIPSIHDTDPMNRGLL